MYLAFVELRKGGANDVAVVNDCGLGQAAGQRLWRILYAKGNRPFFVCGVGARGERIHADVSGDLLLQVSEWHDELTYYLCLLFHPLFPLFVDCHFRFSQFVPGIVPNRAVVEVLFLPSTLQLPIRRGFRFIAQDVGVGQYGLSCPLQPIPVQGGIGRQGFFAPVALVVVMAIFERSTWVRGSGVETAK